MSSIGGAGPWQRRLAMRKLLRTFDKALSMDSTLDVIYSLRGEAQHKREQYTEALADYDQSLQLFPDGAVRIHRRGLARYALEQFEEAAEDFAKSHQVGGTRLSRSAIPR